MAFLSSWGNFMSSFFSLGGIPKFFLLFASPIINNEVFPYILNNCYQLNLKVDSILHEMFENDFKYSLDSSLEEWDLILDLADKNYLKCMGLPQY